MSHLNLSTQEHFPVLPQKSFVMFHVLISSEPVSAGRRQTNLTVAQTQGLLGTQISWCNVYSRASSCQQQQQQKYFAPHGFSISSSECQLDLVRLIAKKQLIIVSFAQSVLLQQNEPKRRWQFRKLLKFHSTFNRNRRLFQLSISLRKSGVLYQQA